jgi:hypothetical protein
VTALIYEIHSKGSNLLQLQEKFGKRPGNKMIDPYWFRMNKFTNKPDYWNIDTNSWKLCKPGYMFDWDDEGSMVCVRN